MRRFSPHLAPLRRGALVAALGAGGGLLLWGGGHSAYLAARQQAETSQALVAQQRQAQEQALLAQLQAQSLNQRLIRAKDKGWIAAPQAGEVPALGPRLSATRYPGLILQPTESRVLAQEAGWGLVSQAFHIHLPLRHEGQFLDLLGQLQSSGAGLLRVQKCQVAWASLPEPERPVGESLQRPMGTLEADCQVERLTLQARAPREGQP